MSRIGQQNSDRDDAPQRPAPGEWTPARGIVQGSFACAVASVILGAGWYKLAAVRPESAVVYLHEDAKVTLFLCLIGALCGFVLAWILFAVMHRASQMVGAIPALVVVVFVIVLAIVKQVAVAQKGVQLPSGMLTGSAWLAPALFIKSNVGVWLGLAGAVWMFKDGDSIMDILGG